MADDFTAALARLKRAATALRDEIAKVVIGQEEIVTQLLVAVFAGGHGLLIGVPGLAKTLLVRTLARAVQLDFRRIQFTPDLMPSDITGTDVLEESPQGRRAFRFVPGPVFAHIVLADEINRTPPKTQAALLEAMQERQVTVGAQTHALPEPFFVIATQNPIEQEGTYPLPEAQLDRFMLSLHIDYPSLAEEEAILEAATLGSPLAADPVLSAKELSAFQQAARQVAASRRVIGLVARLVRATRPGDALAPPYVARLVDWGAGPRAGQYLLAGARTLAALEGRAQVGLEDVQRLAVPVLRHRLSANFQAQAEGIDAAAVIRKLLKDVGDKL